jgi:hypothetical protein
MSKSSYITPVENAYHFVRRSLVDNYNTSRLMFNNSFDVANSLGSDCKSRWHLDRIQGRRHPQSYTPQSALFDYINQHTDKPTDASR